jgi:hypothetical protein
MFGLARSAPRQAHFVTHHCDYCVIREPALPWTVVIQNVTKPKLTLLLH